MRTVYRVMVFFLLVIVSCWGSRKLECQIPEGLTEQETRSFVAKFDKGKDLYRLSCAKCHNYGKGKKADAIPDFNPLQLKAYTIRVQNKDHNKNLTEQRLSEQDLSAVVHFLMYRKKVKEK